MGDQAHIDRCTLTGRCEGHVLGDAFDVTHDPTSGCDGQVIADAAIKDSRTAYVIWNKQIFSPVGPYAGKGWRPYDGPNPHTKHCHVSVQPNQRGNDSPWGWAPEGPVLRVSETGNVKLAVVMAGVFTAFYYAGKALLKW